MSVVLDFLQSAPTIAIAVLGLLFLLAMRLRSLTYSGRRRHFEVQFGVTDVPDGPAKRNVRN
jgi:hypothetical protein